MVQKYASAFPYVKNIALKLVTSSDNVILPMITEPKYIGFSVLIILEFSIHLFQLYTILKSKTRYSKMTEQLRMEIINKVAEVRMY